MREALILPTVQSRLAGTCAPVFRISLRYCENRGSPRSRHPPYRSDSRPALRASPRPKHITSRTLSSLKFTLEDWDSSFVWRSTRALVSMWAGPVWCPTLLYPASFLVFSSPLYIEKEHITVPWFGVGSIDPEAGYLIGEVVLQFNPILYFLLSKAETQQASQPELSSEMITLKRAS